MRKLSILLLFLIVFPIGLFPDEDDQHHEAITTGINEIKVFIRDSDGNHISGLNKDNLTVLLDNKVLKISYFDEISDQISHLSKSTKTSFIEKLEKTETKQIRPNFFIFILSVDNTGKKDTDEISIAIEYFITQIIKPSDYVIFTILDSKGLRLTQNPTNNKGLMKENMKEWIKIYHSDENILPMHQKQSLFNQFTTLTKFIILLKKIPDSKNLILLTNGGNERFGDTRHIMMKVVQQEIRQFISISKEPQEHFLNECESSNTTLTVFLYKNDKATKNISSDGIMYPGSFGFQYSASSNKDKSTDTIKNIYAGYSIPTLGFVSRNATKSAENMQQELVKLYNMQSNYYLLGIQTEGEKIEHSDINITVKDRDNAKILVK